MAASARHSSTPDEDRVEASFPCSSCGRSRSFSADLSFAADRSFGGNIASDTSELPSACLLMSDVEGQTAMVAELHTFNTAQGQHVARIRSRVYSRKSGSMVRRRSLKLGVAQQQPHIKCFTQEFDKYPLVYGVLKT